MERRETDLMEWMTHAVRPRRNLNPDRARLAPAADTRLILELKPVEREFGGCRAAGFSYRYRFRSDSDAIYKLTDCSSWEPGGRASGNMFLMRSCFVPSITRFREPSDFYSSEWYLPECENTRAFQFLPLQTELQGFTFTTGPAGTVVTWANRVGHIRSLFEKERHSEAIRHRHELCGDLSRRFDTPELEVLHFPDALEPHEVCNRYEAVKEVVHETLHAELDFRRERVSTYGMIEEWGNADMERYARIGVPKLAAAGVKKIGLANHFQNNMNVWGVSNMCCTVDYRIAESVGEDKFKLLCSEARRRGVKVEMWGNTAPLHADLAFPSAQRPRGGHPLSAGGGFDHGGAGTGEGAFRADSVERIGGGPLRAGVRGAEPARPGGACLLAEAVGIRGEGAGAARDFPRQQF